jgi:hypothetical protein
MSLTLPLTQTHLSVIIWDQLTHNPIAKMPLYAEVSITTTAPTYQLTEIENLDQFRGTYFFDPGVGPALHAIIAQLVDASVLRGLSADARRQFFEAILTRLLESPGLARRSVTEMRALVKTAVLSVLQNLHIPVSEAQSIVALRSFPLGLLATDHVGYASFDLRRLPKDFPAPGTAGLSIPVEYGFFVFPMGKETGRLDVLAQGRFTDDAIFAKFEIARPVIEHDLKSLSLPSMQSPSLVDWYMSPGSFASQPEFLVGKDGCESLYPSQLALQQFQFRQVIRFRTPPEGVSIPEECRYGCVDDYRVSWYSLGHSLGEIQYSLPLAPGESVKLAVVDWSWASTTQRAEDTKVTEALLHETHRDRSITETVKAALNEWQRGGSFMAGAAGSYSSGQGLGISAAIGGAYATSSGSRDLAAENVQKLSDSFAQASSSQRELFSTVVVQARQEEKESIQTRTFTNYNHGHTLTILYYEVLRHFRVVVEWMRRRPVVLAKIARLTYDQDALIRFRRVFEDHLLDAKLRPGFDAMEHLARIRAEYTLKSIIPGTVTATSSQGDIEFKVFELMITTSHGSTDETDDKIVAFVRKTDGTAVALQYLYVGPHESSDTDAGKDGDLHDINLGNRYDDKGEGGSIFVIPDSPITWRELAGFELEKWGTNAWRVERFSINGIADEISIPLVAEPDSHVNMYFRQSVPGSNSFTAFKRPAPDAPPSSPVNTPEQALGGDDMYMITTLLHHFENNSSHYDRIMALNRDFNDIAVEFESADWGGGDHLIDHLEPYPLETFGDFVAYRYTDELPGPSMLLPDPAAATGTRLLTLPTRGVFAEGKLGHCNVAEEIDNTRFWKWNEHPIPVEAPAINSITAVTPQPQATNVSPTAFPSSLVNIVNPSAAPDPVGLAAALKVMGTPNIFRDMSGIQEVSQLLQTLANNSAGLAAKSGANSGAASGVAAGGGPRPTSANGGAMGDGLTASGPAKAGTPQTVAEVNDLAAGIRQNLPPSQANSLVGKLYQDVVSKNASPVISGKRGVVVNTSSPAYWDTVVDQLNLLTNQHDVDPATGQGSYQIYAARIDAETKDPTNAIGGGFLGVPIAGGVSDEFRALLATAIASLSPADTVEVKAHLGAGSLAGLSKYNPGHGWGYCLDINYARSPYLIGEAGESLLDVQLRPVYSAIARLVLGRDSTITNLPGALPASQVAAFYDALKEESDAFKDYFSFLDRPADLPAAIARWESSHPTGSPPAPAALQSLMNSQYLTLTEHPFVWNPVSGVEDSIAPHPLPQIHAVVNSTQTATLCDRPFKACDPRDGFLDALPKSLVVALCSAGLEWGACMLGSESGDLMHFQYTVPRTCFKRTVDQAKLAASAATLDSSDTTASLGSTGTVDL